MDCVISKCVINLAPDKTAVFREIARVLKPGGRVAISDIALKKLLPSEIGKGKRVSYEHTKALCIQCQCVAVYESREIERYQHTHKYMHSKEFADDIRSSIQRQ